MKIAIVGLGHAFMKQYNALKNIDTIKDIELCDNDEKKITKYNCKNDYLKLDSEYIIIATSPKIHLEMLKKVINQGKKVIIEKPVVRNLQELW